MAAAIRWQPKHVNPYCSEMSPPNDSMGHIYHIRSHASSNSFLSSSLNNKRFFFNNTAFRPSLLPVKYDVRSYKTVTSQMNNSFSAKSKPNDTQFQASIGSAPSPHSFEGFKESSNAVNFLGFVACTLTGAFVLVLLAAIPTLRAIKKAAEAMERLAETAREELPGTMAAVRLSGMEISDLTMELSDLSQEISEGVRSSARAVQAAEDGLRRVGTMASAQTLAIFQDRAAIPVGAVKPAVAMAARHTKHAVVKARKLLGQVSLLRRFYYWVMQIRKSQSPIETRTQTQTKIRKSPEAPNSVLSSKSPLLPSSLDS